MWKQKRRQRLFSIAIMWKQKKAAIVWYSYHVETKKEGNPIGLPSFLHIFNPLIWSQNVVISRST